MAEKNRLHRLVSDGTICVIGLKICVISVNVLTIPPPSPETTGMPVEEGEELMVRLRRIPPDNPACRRMNPAKPKTKVLWRSRVKQGTTALAVGLHLEICVIIK